MVTTRSAEKRSESTRQEDLVLRSRTIESPLSTKSNLAASRKRETEFRRLKESNPKRAKPNLRGERWNEKDIFHSPKASKLQDPESRETETDTIVINQGTDSSVQSKYETANEIIEDSDDAPEIVTTRRSSRNPRNNNRATEPKQRIRIANHDETHESGPPDSQTPMAGASTGSQNTTQDQASVALVVPEVKVTPRGQQVIGEVDPDQVLQLETAEFDGMQSPANNAATKYFNAPSDSVGETYTGATPADRTPIQTSPAISYAKPEVFQIPGGANVVQPVPASTTDPGAIFSTQQMKSDRDVDVNAPQPHNTVETDIDVGQPQKRGPSKPLYAHADAKLLSGPTNIRLPDPARSSLSTFRRSRIEQRAAGAGKGFRLERKWRDKRSAFVAS